MKLLFILLLSSCCDEPLKVDLPETKTYQVSNISITVGLQDPFTGLYWDGTTGADSSPPDLYLGDRTGALLLDDFATGYNTTHVVWPNGFLTNSSSKVRVDIWDKDDGAPQWVWGCETIPEELDPVSHVHACNGYDIELSFAVTAADVKE